MARGRMIANKIARSKDVHNLSDWASRCGFTWLITFADREGRTYGDPAIVKSMIFPREDDITVEQVRKYITEWANEGLIVWYEAKGDLYIWFPGFEDEQPGLRKDREPDSEIPPPPSGSHPEDIRQSSGSHPEDIRLKLIKENEMEINNGGDGVNPANIRQTSGNVPDNIRQTSGRLPEESRIKSMEWNGMEVNNGGDDGRIFAAYKNNIGVITPTISDCLQEYESKYNTQWVLDAIDVAAKNNVRKWAYIAKVLDNWGTNGRDFKPGKPPDKPYVPEDHASEVYQ